MHPPCRPIRPLPTTASPRTTTTVSPAPPRGGCGPYLDYTQFRSTLSAPPARLSHCRRLPRHHRHHHLLLLPRHGNRLDHPAALDRPNPDRQRRQPQIDFQPVFAYCSGDETTFTQIQTAVTPPQKSWYQKAVDDALSADSVHDWLSDFADKLPHFPEKIIDTVDGWRSQPWWRAFKHLPPLQAIDTAFGLRDVFSGKAGKALGDRGVAIVESQTGHGFTGTLEEWWLPARLLLARLRG